MAKLRRGKGTKQSEISAVQVLGTDAMRGRFEGRVVELVMAGHTPLAAERIAAREAVSGRRPE